MHDPDLLTDARQLLNQHGVPEGVINTVLGELRRRYGGDKHFIPKIDRARRHAEIAEDVKAGLPITTIAKRQSCSRSTVRRVMDQWML